MQPVSRKPAAPASSTDIPPISRRLGFTFLVLLSGFCGISYEVLYARILSNFIGDQFLVSASILLTFMLGIGFGTLYAHRLWRWLWLVEGGIGAFGAAFALGSGRVEEWYYAAGALSRDMGGSMLVCFILLSAPAFLIGCSLPLFAGYLNRLGGGRVFARAYMVYNFGAALTVLLIEFWLLRELGIRTTVLAMAALNGLISLYLLLGFRELCVAPPAALEPLPVPGRHLLALVAVSVGSAVFQLLMIKIAESFLGPFRETFAIVLALVLLGIATGSAITSRWRVNFGWLLFAGLLGLLWLVAGYGWVMSGYAAVHEAAVEHPFTAVGHRVLALALLMGLPAIAFGATIPALLGELGSVARESGKLLCVSSLANAAGFLLMALVLHRHWDYGALILWVGGWAALGLVLHGGFRSRPAMAGLAVFATMIAVHRGWWDERLLYSGYESFQSTAMLEGQRQSPTFPEHFKGYQDVYSLNRVGDDIYFFINGYISMRVNSPAEKIVGAFPALFAPRHDRALVLGVGSGATAGTVACLFDQVDAVELNPLMVRNLYRIKEYNFDLGEKPNTRFILDDAIHYARVSRDHYTLIINTVTSPRYFSSAKLYTREFLSSIRQRLTPDGVYVTWIDTRVGAHGLDIILKTVKESFAECLLGGIKGGYYLLLCSQGPIRLQQPDLVATNSVLAGFFQTNGLPPRLLPYALLHTRATDLIKDPKVRVNTTDFPALEFEMARLDDRELIHFSETVAKALDLTALAKGLAPAVQFDPVDFALLANRLYQNSRLLAGSLAAAEKTSEGFEERYAAAELEYYRQYAAGANSADLHHQHASKLMAQGRFEEVLEAERKALALNPASPRSAYNIAYSHENLGKFELAAAYYLGEMRLEAPASDVALGLARAHLKLNQLDTALAYARRANAVEERAENYRCLYRILDAMGKKTEADEAYQRALNFGIQAATNAPGPRLTR